MEKILSKIKLRYFLPLPIILVIISVILFFSGGIGGNPKFVGSSNYLRLFLSDDIFWIALFNTIKLSFILVFGALFFGFVIAFLLAILSKIIKFTISGLFLLSSLYIYYICLGDGYRHINGLLLNFGVIKKPIEFLSLTGDTILIINCLLIFSLLGIVVAIITAGFEYVEYNLKKFETEHFQRSHKRLFTYIPKLSVFPYIAGTIVFFLSLNLSGLMSSLFGLSNEKYVQHMIIDKVSISLAPQINISTIIFSLTFNILLLTVVFFVIYLIGVIIKKLANKVNI